jgi:hypothetical protein
MSMALPLLAFAAALLSALALYAGSVHCPWRWARPLRRPGKWLGTALAIASLVAWIAELGTGAGLCAMLGCWMSALVAMPYLASCTAVPTDGSAR